MSPDSKECSTERTLVLIHQHPYILLGKKKRGFGLGKWNGFGGKLQEGETPIDGAARELHEEAGVCSKHLETAGTIEFIFSQDGTRWNCYIFRGEQMDGTPQETEEMRPAWFSVDEIPFSEMFPDDLYWFPYFLTKTPFHATFYFSDAGANEVHSYTIQEVSSF